MSLLFRLLLLTSCLLLAPTALAEPAPLRLPHPELVGSVAFSPDGKTLATGCHDDILRVWDVATGKERWRVRSPQRNASVVDISPDAKLVPSVSMVSDRISLWDAATGKEVRAIDAGSRGVHHIAFSPDGRLLASAGGDWALAVWDVRTGNRLRHLTGHGGQVLRVVFSPDGQTLVSASQDRTARLGHCDGQGAALPGGTPRLDLCGSLQPRRQQRRLGGHEDAVLLECPHGPSDR